MKTDNHLFHNKSLKVWTRFQPTSADTLKYDLSVHHITMRSVFASLVSVYKAGSIEPQIANKWTVDDSKKEWRMSINTTWTFANGDTVTPQIVLRSFKRVLLIKNKEHSKSGLLEFLSEAEKLTTINDDIDGLQIQGQYVVFRFTKAMPDFLEKVSFGLYAITHPDDYNDDGTWKNAKSAIASGLYEISEWAENVFKLKLRTNLLSNTVTPNSIHEVIFNFSKDPNVMISSDLMIREKYNPLETPDWSFSSAMLDNNIVYIQVMKWDDENSFLSKRENRIIVRDIFYESLKKSGLEATTSFFPLSIKNVKPFKYENNSKFNHHGQKIVTQPFFFNKQAGAKKELGEVYSDAFNLLCNSINAIPVNLDYPEKMEDEKKVFDIQFLGTGILIDAPEDDIRFMFNSKHGIQLPDENGEIRKIIKSDNFDVQEVNRMLWEQGIIWPIRHYSMGFWLKKSKNIDISNLNLALHPIDFQFVKWGNQN